MSEILIYAGDLKVRIDASRTDDIWSYTVINDEPQGGQAFITTFHIEPRVPFSVTQTPNNWATDTDGTTFLLWYTKDVTNGLSPASVLGGFAIQAGPGLADPTPVTVGSMTADTNSVNKMLIGAIRTYAPPIEQISVSGQVINSAGQGVRGAKLSVIDRAGRSKAAITNQLGYFTVGEIPSGDSYVFRVTHRRYRFIDKVLLLKDPRSDLVFEGLE